MGMHAKSLNALAGLDEEVDTLKKYFSDYTNPKPAERSVKKSVSEAAFDELDRALATLWKADNKIPAPAPVTKAMTQARPKVHIRDALGDQSLGTQDAGLAKAADAVELYGSLASAGTIEKANATTAKAANGQPISKAADDEDDDPIGGIVI